MLLKLYLIVTTLCLYDVVPMNIRQDGGVKWGTIFGREMECIRNKVDSLKHH